METRNLSNQEAFALVLAKTRLHFLKQNGVGGGGFTPCLCRMAVGVVLTFAAVLGVGFAEAPFAAIVTTALGGVLAVTAWVVWYDSVETKTEIKRLETALAALA